MSVTHHHILATIATLVREGRVKPRAGRLRILDIGCGDAELIDHLQTGLAKIWPDLEIELHGFDIGEQGYRDDNQFENAIHALTSRHPGIEWRKRLSLFADNEPWRYPAGHFDIAVSNQVIEHVTDLPAFLAEMRRCLSPDGASVHLFPLSSCIMEAHCQTPFAHWIRDFDRRVSWISLLSRIGIGAYRRHRRVLDHKGPADHALETAKYIQCWTRYRSFQAIADDCRAENLGVASGFTKGLFIAKLRALFRLTPPTNYRRSRVVGLDWLYFVIGRYLSSATLIITPVSYDIGRRIAAEKCARNEGPGALRKAA